MNIKLAPLTFSLLFCISSYLMAQDGTKKKDERPKLYQNIEGSYIIGAQIFNDNFVYNPGHSLTASFGKFLNKHVGVGIGAGFKGLEQESFLPVFGEIIGYKKDKNNTPFIKMQLGYSVGWDNRTTQAEGYEYKGGVFVSAGMGRKFKLNNDISINVGWSYQHQFAKMEYDVFSSTSYSEVLNYDMIVISVGIIRKAK